MKGKIFIFIIFVTFISISLFHKQGLSAIYQITAQEAFDMVSQGGATLIDVRTLEEATFVGSPALEAGGEPIAYLISWKLFGGINENGGTIYKDNSHFDALLKQTFDNDKTQGLIFMCAVGLRSTPAAERASQLGFTNLYEIDNAIKEVANGKGGCGGFQGLNYDDKNGYKGYPGRLPDESVTSPIKVVTQSQNLANENDSVSWMDTGLPITHKMNPNKIPKIKSEPSQPSPSTYQNPWMNPIFQPFPFSGTSIYSSFGNSYQVPLTGLLSERSSSFFLSQTLPYIVQQSFLQYPSGGLDYRQFQLSSFPGSSTLQFSSTTNPTLPAWVKPTGGG